MRAITQHIPAICGLVAATMLLAACSSKKNLDTAKLPTQEQSGAASDVPDAVRALTFVQKVSDGGVYARNLSADADFVLALDGDDMSLSGTIRMRRDTVIRLQMNIPLIGTEILRIDFMPDTVLIVDRYHKRYMRASYADVGFLAANGLSFYTLQALFWNRLFLPAERSVSEQQLRRFAADVDVQGDTIPITVAQDRTLFTWKALRGSGRIMEALSTYDGSAHGRSTLRWSYDDFRELGSKYFPARQSFTLTTEATGRQQSLTIGWQMKDFSTDDRWSATTKLSSKYKEIDAADAFDSLLMTK